MEFHFLSLFSCMVLAIITFSWFIVWSLSFWWFWFFENLCWKASDYPTKQVYQWVLQLSFHYLIGSFFLETIYAIYHWAIIVPLTMLISLTYSSGSGLFDHAWTVKKISIIEEVLADSTDVAAVHFRSYSSVHSLSLDFESFCIVLLQHFQIYFF